MKKMLCVLLCLSVVFAAGCSRTEKTSSDENTLSYWVEFNNQATAGVETMGELPVYKAIQEELGIKIDFRHPVRGQAVEQFNLMLSSRDLPDIISYPIADMYPGGVQKAISDGTIITLDLEKKASNLYAYLKEHPEIDKEVKIDSGEYYCFPAINDDKSMLYFYGPFLRKDVLDKVKLEKPVTIDDWYNMLTKFKNEGGIESPMIMDFENLISMFGEAFGVSRGFGVVDGEVCYKLVDGDIKGFLSTMKKWYNEGLIDKNLASVDGQMVKSYMVKGTSGVTAGTLGGSLGAWQTIFNQEGDGWELSAVAKPLLNKDDKKTVYEHASQYNSFGSASITTQCKNPELAYKLLDFGYSEKGRMLFNFGIEGESYSMVDGYPKYTELVSKNPDGKSMSDMIQYYCCPNGSQPTIRDMRYYEQYQSLPQQQEALGIWYNPQTVDCSLPRVTLTDEETAEIQGIDNDLKTYADAYMLKVITGVEDLESTFDSYLDNMKQRGVDKLVKVYQQAYERYLTR